MAVLIHQPEKTLRDMEGHVYDTEEALGIRDRRGKRRMDNVGTSRLLDSEKEVKWA